jgi:hypothetical protein
VIFGCVVSLPSLCRMVNCPPGTAGPTEAGFCASSSAGIVAIRGDASVWPYITYSPPPAARILASNSVSSSGRSLPPAWVSLRSRG